MLLKVKFLYKCKLIYINQGKKVRIKEWQRNSKSVPNQQRNNNHTNQSNSSTSNKPQTIVRYSLITN